MNVRWQGPVALAVGLGLVLAMGPSARAQGTTGWRGEYFNNTSLEGRPAMSRTDAELDFSWGFGSPAPGVINPDYFSIRWTRAVDVAPGKYRVVVRSDDGFRVRLDGQTIVDRWYPQPSTPYGFEVNLTTSHHDLAVEYFEQTGNAEFHGAIEPAQPIEPAAGSFLGQYFANQNLAGTPAVTRPDAGINFDWGTGSPFPGVIPADHFSVRWTGTVGGPPGTYLFTTTTDDGVRLWVNDRLVIDQWHVQAPTAWSATVSLSAPAAVRMDYFDDVGSAVAKLAWYRVAAPSGGTAPSGAAPAPPPGIIVDFGSPGYQQGGDAAGWHSANGGYQGIRWALNRYQESPGYQWARWYPSLAAGSYEVFIFIPGQDATTHSATYWVSHAGQFTSKVVNQNSYSNAWVSLGTYQFVGDGTEYVSLNVVTGEPEASKQVGFDAVRFAPK